MFCSKCGKELEKEWKVCPKCGQKIKRTDGGEETCGNPISQQILQPNVPDKTRNSKPFFQWIPAIACIIAGMIIIVSHWIFTAGVFLILAGVLLCPVLLNKLPGKKRMLVIVPAMLLIGIVCVDAIRWTRTTNGDVLIEYVKEYHAPNAYFSIGEGIEMDAGSHAKWTYDKKDGKDYVSVKFTLSSGRETVEITFSVDDYPELYHVKINGKSDAEAFAGYKNALFGIEEHRDSLHTENPSTETDVAEMDDETSMQQDQVKESASVKDEDRIWFVTYNQFQSDHKSLIIVPVTDALMEVSCSGSDGSSVTWDFSLDPDQVEEDGTMVYHDGKDVSMRYSPADHQMDIVTSNDAYAGTYQYKFDFEGIWTDSYSQRCSMEIICQNDKYYEILIDWSGSASDHSHWEFLAEYDEERACLVYENGRHTEQHYPDDGSGMQETEVYSNGRGEIYQQDGKLYWNDQTEHAGSDCVFEK